MDGASLEGHPKRITGGAPPEGHLRQCRANSQVTRVRCRRWALRTSNYCQFHGGRRAQAIYCRTGKRRLPVIYSKFLGPKLSERVRELLDKPHDEQISLYQELAIARANACEALKLASPLYDEELSEKLTPEIKSLMISTLSTAMTEVKDLVLAASRLEKEAGEKVSLKVVNLIVMQIVLAINDVCGTEYLGLAEAIALAIDERVRLPLNDKLNPIIKVNIGNVDSS